MDSSEVKTLFEMDSYENGKIKNEVFKSSIVIENFSTETESNEVSVESKKIRNVMKNHHFSKQHCVQYGISLIVTLSAFATGMQFGWIGPTLHKLMLNETNIQIDNSSGISWIAGNLKLGGIFGPFLGSFLADACGRKTTILLAAFPLLIAWFIICIANKIYQLCIAEFISGVATQTIFTILPIYIGEIVSPKIRGTLAMFIPLQFYMGFLLENIIVPKISVMFNSVIAILVILLLLCSFCWMPESPYYFLMKNHSEKAARSLRVLTQTDYVEAKMETIKDAIDTKREIKIDFLKLYKDPINLCSFWIVLGVASLHQFCGFVVVLLYAQVILELADTPIDANLGGSILSAVGILVYFVSIISVDNWGRRPLLIISSITTAVSLIMIGLYFHLKRFNYENISSFSIVPVIALILFKISYGLGIGPLFFVYSSEMFNTHFKSYAMCLLYSYMSLTNFIIVKMFYIIAEFYGEFYPFYFFAFCSLCGTLFRFFQLD
ncbi:facilitated trehalose transporter Tret1-like [Chrysoperla carnea]|uniref:facilitated trehalose transporter Tret1-like n=1 Tax=Chrysoperla carnea TaxID=189513 RepID=UPI001D0676C5|nr:facilitated trehalose transporter Tret1-like [Chrysoperla carnea]